MAFSLSVFGCVFIVGTVLFGVDGQKQVPFLVGEKGLDLIYELKKAEIIPTVISEFTPLLTISVSWKNATANYGNTVNPSKSKKQPKIEFINSDPDTWSAFYKDNETPQLTIAMSDPDAPSRDNPEWSEICHWIATDVKLTEPDHHDDDDDDDDDEHDGDYHGQDGHDDDDDDHNHYDRNASRLKKHQKRMLDVMPYKPPGPPPKTGKHRYVFVALVPKNGTTDSLNLRKPGDRQHWGFKHERDGLSMWAEEMGLEVVGANFIYEQNDEQ